jgi:branched-chain amino acid aminotransferase
MNEQASCGIGYMDGCYMPRDHVALPTTDVGFKLCDMCYDAIHVWRGRFFRLEDHLDRFFASIEKRRFNFRFSREEVRDALTECVRRSGLRDSMTMLIATRGDMKGPVFDLRNCESRFIAWADPYYGVVSEEEACSGVGVVISRVPRVPADSIDPTVKNFARIDFADALFDAYDQGCRHALLLDHQGNVTEGRGWNVFAVFGGAVVTPEGGVLEGITRKTVLELCEQGNLEARVAVLPGSELGRADEVFMASTAGGLMPVTHIDGKAVGSGSPGPHTLRLTDLYWQLHEDPAYSTPVVSAPVISPG